MSNNREINIKLCFDWLQRCNILTISIDSSKENEKLLHNLLSDGLFLLMILQTLSPECPINDYKSFPIKQIKEFNRISIEHFGIGEENTLDANFVLEGLGIDKIIAILSKISNSERVRKLGIQGFSPKHFYRASVNSVSQRKNPYTRYSRRRIQSAGSSPFYIPKKPDTIQNVINKIIENEKLYFSQLKDLKLIFMPSMKSFHEYPVIFRYVEEMFSLHQKTFKTFQSVNHKNDDEYNSFMVYINLCRHWTVYYGFIINQPHALKILNDLMVNDTNKRQIVKNCEAQASDEDGYLMKILEAPASWILNYRTLFQYLTQLNGDVALYTELYEMFSDILNNINVVRNDQNNKRQLNQLQNDILLGMTKPVDVSHLGRLHKSGAERVQLLDNNTKELRQIYLFETALVVILRKSDLRIVEATVLYLPSEEPQQTICDGTGEISIIINTSPKGIAIFSQDQVIQEEWYSALVDIIKRQNMITIAQCTSLYGFHRCMSCQNLIHGCYQNIYQRHDNGFIFHQHCLNKNIPDPCGCHRYVRIIEIINTEYNYIEALETILYVYRAPFNIDQSSILCQFYSVIQNIFHLHQNLLTDMVLATKLHLQINLDYPSFLELFRQYRDRLLMYSDYFLLNRELINSGCLNSPEFEACQKMSGKFVRYNIADLVIRPTQRITKYSLLLQELLNEDKDHNYQVARAKRAIDDVVNHCNQVQLDTEMEVEIMQYSSRITSMNLGDKAKYLSIYGKLRKAGNIKVSIGDTNSELRHLFIFEKLILVTHCSQQNVFKFYAAFHLPNRKLKDNYHDFKLVMEVSDGTRARCKLTLHCESQCMMLEWRAIINDVINRYNSIRNMVSNHKFVLSTFDQPPTCYICNHLMIGKISQGYKCSITKNTYHYECLIEQFRFSEMSDSLSTPFSPNPRRSTFTIPTFFRNSTNESDATIDFCNVTSRSDSPQNSDDELSTSQVSTANQKDQPVRDVSNNDNKGEDLEDYWTRFADCYKTLTMLLSQISQIISHDISIFNNGPVEIEKVEENKVCWSILNKTIKEILLVQSAGCENYPNTSNINIIHLCNLLYSNLSLYGQYYHLILPIKSTPSSPVTSIPQLFSSSLLSQYRHIKLNVTPTNMTLTQLLRQPIIIIYQLVFILEKSMSIKAANYEEIKECYDNMKYGYRFLISIEFDFKQLEDIQYLQEMIPSYNLINSNHLCDYGHLRKEAVLPIRMASEQFDKIRKVFLFDKIIILALSLADFHEFEIAYHLEKPAPELDGVHLKIYVSQDSTMDQIIFNFDCQNTARLWESAVLMSINRCFPIKNNQYRFQLTSFTAFENCNFCGRLLFGLFCQGYQCTNTNTICHEHCLVEIQQQSRKPSVSGQIPLKVHRMALEAAYKTLIGSCAGTFVVHVLCRHDDGQVSSSSSSSSSSNDQLYITVMDKQPIHIKIDRTNHTYKLGKCCFNSIRTLVQHFTKYHLNQHHPSIETCHLKLEYPVTDNIVMAIS